MTKRTLFIIIGLLLFLDLAAFFVYLVGHSNSDGKSPIEYALRDKTASAEVGELPEKVIPDEFDTITMASDYISHDKAGVGVNAVSMTCEVKLKFIWPKNINGNDRLGNLNRELLNILDAGGNDNARDAAHYLLKHPEFVKPSSNFSRLPSSDHKPVINHTLQYYRVFPYISTNYLLEMMVLIEKHDGLDLTRDMRIVHYDRVRHSVVTFDQIFDTSRTTDILALINQNIEAEKLSGNHPNWHETEVMPTEFLLGKKSVMFYFSDGAIAPKGSGLHEISVKNENLEEFFTPFYNELRNNDTHFETYDFIIL
ncbi:MAG: hypothetical protein IJM66_03880 [Muribaculaceae bacterium]|nr:hypothetical protein [Muribaculaceae bacterium]